MSTPPDAATHAEPGARRTTPDALIAAADLPAPVSDRIAAIVRTTRLWKSERADIARELIAHAKDALSAGRTPEDTAESLGDPTTVAKLLRRSARRKRPWHWQARRRVLQAIGISLLAMIGVYAVLFVRFNTGSPSITHNYLAELNERNADHPPSQHALPAFDDLQRAWSPEFRTLLSFKTHDEQGNELRPHAMEQYPYARPDARAYDELRAAHARVRPQIDAAIAASRRPVLGLLYSDRYEEVPAEDGSIEYRMLPPSDDPAQSGLLIEVLLPWLGHARSNAQLIAFDAFAAAQSQDADRVGASLETVFDTARLIGQEHTLIASLVAIAIQSTGETALLQILHEHPNLLDESHLAALAHSAAVSGRIARDLDLETERRVFADFLQRAYTDDGHGDGHLTAEGLRLARYVDAITIDGADLENSLLTPVAGPLAMVAFGSRRDQDEINARLIDLAGALLAAPPGSAESFRIRKEIAKQEETLGSSRRYAMAATLTPALTRAVENAHRARAHTNATLTTIALHIHHQRTGRWPDTLEELTPALLPTIPEDPFDPGRPIKYRLIDGVPHVYFVGSNGQDNQARRPDDKNIPSVSSLSDRYTRSPSTAPEFQADWIIYPPTAD